ncbi:MAG: hypothetical protein ACLRFJ_00350, partial [Alphaproteobacteria bacterium]
KGFPRHTPAGHSLALKLRFACFRLLIVEPGFSSVFPMHKNKTPIWVFDFSGGNEGIPSAYACGAFVSAQTALCLFSLTHCRTRILIRVSDA